MAEAGQEITNGATRERIRFLRTSKDTGGDYLEFESWWQPGPRAFAHVHPRMTERWEVLSGQASFEIDGELSEAAPGQAVVAEAGQPHRAWNPGPGETHLLMRLSPALRWEEFMVRLFELQSSGAAGEEFAALFADFPDEIAIPS